MIDPDQMRREIFDNLLKKRIFIADRIEKVEKVLVSMSLISKEQLYCSNEQLALFMEEFRKEENMKKVFSILENDREELWFDIYRSITTGGAS